MANSDLLKYIEAARAQKVPDETTKAQLIKSGWSEHDVTDALTPSSASGPSLPPPPVPQFGMWVSFQYIILFICLYVWATSFGGILHHGVDKLIKDELDNTSLNYYGSVDDWLLKTYIAGISVAFPIFALLFIVLKRQLLNKPAVKNLRARKILIYLTLVGTFLIMLGHVIMTIFNFLGGNTSMRSLGHLGVTFLVAGSIFVYLLNEVREDRKTG